MSNFMDKIRGKPTPERLASIKAWDPDTGSTGWAEMHVSLNNGVWRALEVSAGSIRHAHQKTKGAVKVGHMIDAIRQYATSTGSHGHVIIEGQEFYAESKVNANDLIHLAQVAGAIRAVVRVIPSTVVTMPLPREWKGTKKKEGMHERARKLLGDLIPSGVDIHAMDAVCMCIWKANQLAIVHAASKP